MSAPRPAPPRDRERYRGLLDDLDVVENELRRARTVRLPLGVVVPIYLIVRVIAFVATGLALWLGVITAFSLLA